MGVMSVYNMDIEEFINAKSYDAGKLVHFNVSVMVDNDFMKAVKEDKDIFLHYPVYDESGKILKDESEWKAKKSIKATYLWELIMQKAYDNGEPGIFFYENLNDDNTLWYIENVICTNPCAEYLAGTVYGNNPITNEKLDRTNYGGACNLGSVFLHNMIDNPFTSKAKINYEKLRKTIFTAVKLLDNIIDINSFPSQIYKNYQESFRTIGLGITGLGDMLCMLNMKYGSKDAVKFTDDLMNFFAKEAYKASIELSKEKGSFPFLDREKFVKCGFINKHINKDKEWEIIAKDILKYGIRNSKILSVAPTGTMSLTFGNNCSSGLEPIFSLSYERKVKMGGQSDDNIKIVKMEDYAYKLWQEIKHDNIVKEDIFVTAMNLSVQAHLDMLKVIAYHIDMSCSKTINIPTDYPYEETKKVYEFAWKNGIKGCTIFRPNPIRQGILISESTPKPNEETINVQDLPRGTVIQVDDSLIGKKRKLVTGCGSLHVEAFFDMDNGNMMEVFLSKGSQGGCNSFMGGLSRMISVALRGGVHINDVVDQLDSVLSCPSYAVRQAVKKDASKGKCCPDAIGRSLLEMQKEMWNEVRINDDYIESTKLEQKSLDLGLTKEEKQYLKENGELVFAKHFNKCPNCGSELKQEGGCISCTDCGWSKCD